MLIQSTGDYESLTGEGLTANGLTSERLKSVAAVAEGRTHIPLAFGQIPYISCHALL